MIQWWQLVWNCQSASISFVASRSQIRGVIFDWDGTLLNSFAADLHAYKALFHSFGLNWGEAEIETHYSPNWHRVYEAADIPRGRWEEADRIWRQAYRTQRPRLLPGARNTLRVLSRKFSLALVTSGNKSRVSAQLNQFGLIRLFAARIFGDDCARKKPNPEALNKALQRLRLSAAECVYVGDAPEDISMARAAGARAVAVMGPYPTRDRVKAARPDAILDSVVELPRWLAMVQ
jgi:HAD superfamily hydrolase (TIGR01509 family)